MNEWIKLVTEWEYVREVQNRDFKENLSEVLIELANAILGDKTS